MTTGWYQKVGLAAAMVAAFWLSTCSAGGAAELSTATSTIAPTDGAATAVVANTIDSSGLTGKLIYSTNLQGIMKYDFGTGQVSSLFVPPANSSVGSMAVSPDGQWIVVAYAAPPEDGSVNLGFTELYIMPADGSTEPTVLLHAQNGELYSFPTWSPDGKFIYFGHAVTSTEAAGATVEIDRMTYPALGQPEKIIDKAYWPRFSPDGSKLVYLLYAQSFDALVVANADGSNSVQPIPDGYFSTVDAPTFSTDGQQIAFSAVSLNPAAPTAEPMSWIDQIFGVKIARAHTVPSDLYVIPSSGGTPTALTSIGGMGIYPSYSPDGSHIAYLSLDGITIIDAKGGNPQQLISGGSYGTLQWIP